MSIAIAGASARSLTFAADTKIHRLDPATRRVTNALGSKITCYGVDDGMLVIAYAGLWDPGSSDDVFLDLLRLWMAAAHSVAALSDDLMRRLARPLTARALREANASGLARNVSEFLVGWQPRHADPEVWCVTRDTAAPVPAGAMHAIGGREDWTLAQADPAGGEIDGPAVRRTLHEVLTTVPSDAYDFPIEVVEVTAQAPAAIRRTFYERDGAAVSAPQLVGQIPPELPRSPARRRFAGLRFRG